MGLRYSLDDELCRARSEIDGEQLFRRRRGARSVVSKASGLIRLDVTWPFVSHRSAFEERAGEVRRMNKWSTKEPRVFDAYRAVVVTMASPGSLERPFHFVKVSPAPKGPTHRARRPC